jgi:outer membrane protein OmpA-like peptidoglycan-associated protein
VAERAATDRLTAKVYSAEQPPVANDTGEGRAINRRMELVKQ